MENKKSEQLVYLKDLLFVLLRGWRVLVISALIVAILLGGMKLVSGVKEISAANDASVDMLIHAKEAYAQQVKAADAAVDEAQKARDAQLAYVDESVLMRLNAEEYYQVELTYYIKIDSKAVLVNESKILTHYVNALHNGVVAARIAASVGEKQSYVRDIYYAEMDEEAVTFRVVGICDTEEMANKMLTAVKKEISTAHKNIVMIRGEHELVIVGEGVSEESNADVKARQQQARDLLAEKEAVLAQAQGARAALVEPAVLQTPKSQAMKPAVKYGVVGGVVGFALVAVYLWLRLIFGTKVYAARTLCNITDINLLGSVSGKENKNPVDRWILTAEGRAMNDREARIKLLATDISKRCAEYESLVVVGDGNADDRTALIEELAEQISGLRLLNVGSLLQDFQALEALATNQAVLLIEQCGESSYSGVERELRVVADYGKKLIGCILLDG